MTQTRQGLTARQWWAAGLLTISAVTTVSTLFDIGWGGRTIVGLAFFLLVPGCSVVSAIGVDDLLAEVTIGVAVSMALGTVVAMLMLWLHLWHPAAAQFVLAGLSAPLLINQLRNRQRLDATMRPRPDAAEST